VIDFILAVIDCSQGKKLTFTYSIERYWELLLVNTPTILLATLKRGQEDGNASAKTPALSLSEPPNQDHT